MNEIPKQHEIRDLTLADTPTISKAFSAVLRQEVQEDKIPAIVHQGIRTMLGNTVRLVREGTRSEIREARDIIDKPDIYYIRKAESAEEARELVGSFLATMNTLLAVADSPYTGLEYAVIRQPDHQAAKLLCVISDKQPANLPELGHTNSWRHVHVDELAEACSISDVRKPLWDLYEAGMIESHDGGFDDDTVRVRLSPLFEHQANPEVMVLARYYAEQFDAQQAAGKN